ncbi:carbonic anhydrase [Cristinia sonorae]|uniref:Carbonic anhydrase n=1 Tax=Cristinia sonorae TaxID=1940300 RepID=A0A8K0XK25_9AGAR|nr:carbonic anhydrase [Cristinia sonorae]
MAFFGHLYLLLVLILSLGLSAVTAHRTPGRLARRQEGGGVVVPTDQVLGTLLAQNEVWAANIDATRAGFFNQSAQGQFPKVLWIGCSDSRVPESVIMDSLPGTIFVQRNIANQVPSEDTAVVATISYAVEHLEIDRIIVAGHTHCGGVTFCYENAMALPTPIPDPLPPMPDKSLDAWLNPLYRTAKKREDGLLQLTVENVRIQVENVAGIEAVKEAWSKGRDVRVVGWLHELETGRLMDLDLCRGLAGSCHQR